MTASIAPLSSPPAAAPLAEIRPPMVAYRRAFLGLVARDLHVLRKQGPLFVVRTIMQPLLLMFVFTYVFPKIGQGVGGQGDRAASFSSLLVAGVIGSVIIFQGIQSVALPLVQEFGFSKEIEDRVLAPLPTKAVGIEKIVAGTLQSILAAIIVFPIAAVVPATPVHLHIVWWQLITLVPLAGWVSSAFGLVMGTKVGPTQVPVLFAVIVIPITFLGAVYYPWPSLAPIRWLQWAVLINPLVYINEGLRTALVSGVHHMALPYVYGGLLAFAAVLTYIGVKGFAVRTVS